MNSKTIGIILVVVIILGAGWYFYATQNSTTEPVTGSNTTSGMLAEDNAVMAQDQKPGNTVVVSQVYLAAPGYVVIHDETGAILGSSSLLSAGQSDTVTVQLSRSSEEGEVFQAMLHNELNNNATFEASADSPVSSVLGGVIVGTFTVSSEANGNTPISL